MMRSGQLTDNANTAFGGKGGTAAKTAKSSRRAISPLTLRLTEEERANLEELAAGMTLSTYVRACVFGQEAKRRKRRSKDTIEDKKAAAEALALLGQSRIANNLNQLAYHANIGALEVGDAERAKIDEAYAHVLAIRALLLQALGKSSTSIQGCETAASHCVRTRSHQDHSEGSE